MCHNPTREEESMVQLKWRPPWARREASNPEFDTLLEGTIRETMVDVFGLKSANNIIDVMQEKHNLKIEEVPRRSNEFNKALRNIIGSGHIIIEDLILEDVSDKLGQKYESKMNKGFGEYVRYLRQKSRR